MTTASDASQQLRPAESTSSIVRQRRTPLPVQEDSGSGTEGRPRESHNTNNTSYVTSHSVTSKGGADFAEKRGRSSSLSPECHLFAMLFCLVLLASSIYVYKHITSLPPPLDPITHTYIRSREIKRAVVAIISDSLDCSIYIKQLQMKRVADNALLLHGMMCLYLTEPHSFAPDAGYSLSFHFHQSRDALAARYAQGYFDGDRIECVKRENATRKHDCPLQVFIVHRFAKASLETKRFADSDIPSQMLMNLDSLYRANYNKTFSLFARFADSGPNPRYPQALQTDGYNQTVGEETSHRVFRVSPLLVKMNKQYPNKLANWRTMIFGSGGRTQMTTNTELNVTKEVARDLVHHYFYTNRSREDYNQELNEVRMSVSQKTTTEFVLTWPKGAATSSAITAFLIKTVYKAMAKGTKFRHPGQKEALLYASFLVAQRRVYQLLPKTAEWDPIKNTKSLFDYQDEVVAVLEGLRKTPEGASSHMAIPSDVVTRGEADRVGTLMRWSAEKGETAICLLNSALPEPFDSIDVTSGKKLKRTNFAPFSQKGGGQSQPFSSAAAISVFESFHTGTANGYIPRIVASASGSLRTIEAVAFPVLRHLLLKESPGEAVYAPAAFVSLLDGSVRCELARKTKDEVVFAMSNVMAILMKIYKIDCKEVENVFEEQDRAAYLIVREGKGRTQATHLTAAVDERAPNFNYATGY